MARLYERHIYQGVVSRLKDVHPVPGRPGAISLRELKIKPGGDEPAGGIDAHNLRLAASGGSSIPKLVLNATSLTWLAFSLVRVATARSCSIALAAVEMNDREIADLCLHALDTECPAISQDGRSFRPNASIWAHAVEMMALSAQTDGFRHLIETPRSSGNGPVIAELNYHDVLVAKAVHDSKGLQATLYPGSGVARQGIVLGGLHPGARYRCKGSEEELIHASPEGCAELHVHLDGRKEIRVFPAF